VHIWSIPSARHSFQDIRDLPIDTPAGDKVKLSDVADVRFAPSPNAILRDDQSRRIDVEANIAEGGDLGAAVAEVERRVAAMDFPPEYSVKVLGESSELEESQNTLAVYGLAALAVIFLLLHGAFGSIRLAALAFLLLPVSIVGGVLVIALTDGLMSLGSLVGFLTVFGIAARNGILMINHFQHLEHEEGVQFGPELVMRGASERLAPIMMTALATALAIVPLAVAGSIPGHEIEHPMALVILGGLFTATLLNLFIIPSLYLRFAKSKKERQALAANA
jgi:Cu/Ag efflux pump CusA